jgi:hypothetical protein
VPAVNQLLKQFGEMQKMMRQMGGGSMPSMPRGMGKLAEVAARRGALPAGLGADASPARTVPATAPLGPRNKKKKGGRVTPPKPR